MSEFQQRMQRLDIDADIASSEQAAWFWTVVALAFLALAGALCWLSPLVTPRAFAMLVAGICFAATAMHRLAIGVYARRLADLS